MSHRKVLIPLFVFSIGCMIWACKGRKTVNDITIREVENISADPLAVSIESSDYQWFDAKFNADIVTRGSSNSVSGKIKIRRDSVVWVSIRGAGIIEVFRLMATPDSVKLINYLDKTYFTGDYVYLKNMIHFDVNYELVQSLFTGDPYFIMPRKDYKVSLDGTDTVLSTSAVNDYTTMKKSGQRPNLLFQALWTNAQSKLFREVAYDPSNAVELEVKYDNFTSIDSVLYPQNVKATIIGDTANAAFTIEYSGIELNITGTFPFNIPKTYRKLE